MLNYSRILEVAQKELISICYHEASHSAVAFHFGVINHWRIWVETEQFKIEEKFFTGCCYLFNAPESEYETRMIGLAGKIAECLLENESVVGWQIDEYLSFGIYELSDTDKESAGNFQEVDLDACLSLVKSLWPKIKQDAERRINVHQDDVMELVNHLFSDGVSHE